VLELRRKNYRISECHLIFSQLSLLFWSFRAHDAVYQTDAVVEAELEFLALGSVEDSLIHCGLTTAVVLAQYVLLEGEVLPDILEVCFLIVVHLLLLVLRVLNLIMEVWQHPRDKRVLSVERRRARVELTGVHGKLVKA
jgi:hypothetical protein